MEISATCEGLARLDGDELAVVDLPYPDIGALLAAGRPLADVETAPVKRRLPADRLDGIVRPPVPLHGTTVWGVGLNYHAKAKLTGRPTPTFPILYIKPLTALSGPTDPVHLVDGLSEQMDYEGEVGVVIGRPMSGVTADDAWDHVAGIVCGNDVTARDIMKDHGNPLLAKGMPGVSPLGPTVLPLSDLPDRDDIPVRTWWNGELVQDGRTSDLIFPVAELLAIISRFACLAPGDVVLTGTPPGTGQDLGRYLHAGDEVTVQVAAMRPLRTSVRASVGEPVGAPA